MSEEINKILKDMDLIVNHNKVPIYYTQNHIKLLLDYITNLQQENKQLKEENARLWSQNKDLEDKILWQEEHI